MKGLFIPEITAEMFRNGCLESIESLMAEGEIYDIDYSPFISCSVRLPEKDGHYIVYAPTYIGGSSSSKEYHDGVMFSAFKKGKWSIEHGYHKRPNCVVAWMPLPKPYRESEVK